MTTALRTREGHVVHLDVDRWSARASAQERSLLASVRGPVLDLGCGPGRLTLALGEMGTPALGIDASPNAVEQTHASGASAICRSLFDRLPGEGRWRAVLLFDGNIGIGGDPARLLARVAELVAPDGVALVEVDPPGSVSRARDVCIETAGGAGPWFTWAWVGADDIATIASAAGFRVATLLQLGIRWVAVLEHHAA